MSDTQVMAGLLVALSTIVGLLVWVVKRKPSEAITPLPRMSVEDEIARDIALIERENVDLPRNWREWVDIRIEHKLRNLRHRSLSYAHLLERGQVERVTAFLKEDAEE